MILKMNWLNFGEILSYLICFSGTDTEDENDVEEESESITEQLPDETTRDTSGTTVFIEGTGKLLILF